MPFLLRDRTALKAGAVAGAIIVLVLILGAIVARGAYVIIVGGLHLRAENAARIAEAHVIRVLDGAETLLDVVAERWERPTASDGAPGALHLFLGKARAHQDQYQAVFLIDPTGRVVESSRQEGIGLDLSDRPYFREHLRSDSPELYVGAPILDRPTGTWGVPISKAIRGPDHELRGVGVVLLNPGYFDRFFGALDLGAGGSLVLLRSDGRLLAGHPYEPLLMGALLPDSDRLGLDVEEAPVATIEALQFAPEARGFFSYRADNAWGFIVGAGIDGGHIRDVWWRQTKSCLLMVAALVLAIACAAIMLARAHLRLATARDAALASNRAKEAFLAGMSHELRTPLNAIIGFSEMMQAEMLGPLPTRYHGYAADIRESGQHLRDIVDDILETAALQAGTLELHLSDFSIEDAVTECVRISASGASAAGVVLAHEIPPDAGALCADRSLFTRTLINLLSNAVKFTAPGGRILITAKRGPGELRLTVSDSGAGMAPAEVANVLSLFGHFDGRHGCARGSFGLGLSLAKGYTERHGGRFEISSEPGRGTTVLVAFPARPAGSLAPTALAA